MKRPNDRVMFFLAALAGSLLIAALLATPSNILSSSMLFPTGQPVDDAARSKSPLALALESVRDGSAPIKLRDPVSVAAVYAGRRYFPLWYSGERLNRGGRDLFDVLAQAKEHGLNPEHYVPGAMNWNPSPPAMRELLLTDALLAYSRDLGSGRSDPAAVYWKWEPPVGRNTAASISQDVVTFLQSVPQSGRNLSARSLAQLLQGFEPTHRDYQLLKESLMAHLAVVEKGGWPTIQPGPDIYPGDAGERVVQLCRRLFPAGDFSGQEDFYGEALAEAVFLFQKQMGLPENGIVGRETLAALNASAEERVQCIAGNMDRLRWLPKTLGDRHVRVNIPAFDLQMWDPSGLVGGMAVVVGRGNRPTPVMSKDMSAMVVNPYWNIPIKLARNDILPAVKRDANYLRARGIRVFSGWDSGAREIDPAGINWQDIEAQNLPYRFRQDPGPRNALGRVKFLFPNRFAVYLHDTNYRSAFKKSGRAMSSGCVRVQEPSQLADFVMAGIKNWNQSSYNESLSRGDSMTLSIPQPVKIHLLYLTAFVDETGALNFRQDLYGYDKKMARFMPR